MTGAPQPIQRTHHRRLARGATIVLSLLLSVTAAFALWSYSDQSACGAETPAAFSSLYSITSESMAPTILKGDLVWSRRHYFCNHDPARGDLAMLTPPNGGRAVFVKRIVGLPGDRVQLKAAQLFINGKPVTREWMDSAIHAEESGDAQGVSHFSESFQNGPRYTIEIADPEGPLENTEEITVPDGAYFVLGDNRDKSDDSRQSQAFGLVPRALIVDRPIRILWGADWNRVGLKLQ
jgi:signal peptidase I